MIESFPGQFPCQCLAYLEGAGPLTRSFQISAQMIHQVLAHLVLRAQVLDDLGTLPTQYSLAKNLSVTLYENESMMSVIS
jgi:hypothetical protein